MIGLLSDSRITTKVFSMNGDGPKHGLKNRDRSSQ